MLERAHTGHFSAPADPGDLVAPVFKLLDALVADAGARDAAKLELLRLAAQEPDALSAPLLALARAREAADPWTARARPGFLYVMYALLLWSLPMGLICAIRPHAGEAIARGMAAYLHGIPEPLYALFGTGYLGYTVARTWGKVKGADR